MGDVQNFINQQLGLKKWRNCDSAISRLRCVKGDEYKQILSSDEIDSDLPDTPIFACKFAQRPSYEHLLALANEDGTVAIHDTNTGQRYGQQLHYNAIFDLAWMFEQMKIVTVSGDHTARLFDVSNGEIRSERVFNGHTRSVKTVAVRQNDRSVFATGGRDGSIIVWDTRSNYPGTSYSAPELSNNMPDRIIHNSHFVSAVGTPTSKGKKKQGITGANSVTGLVFQDENTLISCGAGDGAIKLWDLRKNYHTYKKDPIPRALIPYCGKSNRNGFSNIILDRDGIRLYANCLDNTIYCYNVGTCNPEPVMKFIGHQNSTFFVKSSLSSDGLYLLSGSSDQNAYIWNVNGTYPLAKLKGHNAEVTCVAWRQKGETLLVTCSDDMKHKLWRIGPEEVPDNWEIIGCGSAERVHRANEVSYLLNDKTLENRLKRLLENNDLPLKGAKKLIRECPKCECSTPNEDACENCAEKTAQSKRKNPEEICSENKRVQTEKGPRRLFISGNKNAIPNDNTEMLATVLANAQEKQEVNNTEKTLKLIENLPNFAIDGSTPHLHYSPQKRKDKDWLTKLRIERSLFKEMQELAGPSPAKLPKTDSSPKVRTPKQQQRCASPKSPLLRFFKVTNNAAKCDTQQCTTKTQNSVPTMQQV